MGGGKSVDLEAATMAARADRNLVTILPAEAEA
jgi:hypothetical protein